MDVAKLAEQRREAFIDEARIERGDVGARTFSLQDRVTVGAQPGTAGGATDVQT